jgi:8-oxo-dGTP pyrophosphatase MutT (NUDIX family)
MSADEAPGKGTAYVAITTGFICHDGNGHIFMAKRSAQARDEQNTWETGGGGLDFGFTAESNAIKEIEEEYSATPEEIAYLGYRDVFRQLPDGTPTHWLALDFIARLDPAKTKINEPHKFDDSGWFDPNELPSPLHSQVEHILGKYASQLAQYNIHA